MAYSKVQREKTRKRHYTKMFTDLISRELGYS